MYFTLTLKPRRNLAMQWVGLEERGSAFPHFPLLPYGNGLTERTLRQLLVHPKDKRETTETGNCIYKIWCQNCDHNLMSVKRLECLESDSQSTRLKSKKSARKNTPVPNLKRRASEQEQTTSAISDHVARANHVIDFENHKNWVVNIAREKEAMESESDGTRHSTGRKALTS